MEVYAQMLLEQMRIDINIAAVEKDLSVNLLCCGQELVDDDHGDLVCDHCGLVRENMGRMHNHFEMPHTDDSYAKPNHGYEKPQKKRYYSPLSNLREHMNRILGIKNPVYCKNWNNGLPCVNDDKIYYYANHGPKQYICFDNHKCSRCDAPHRLVDCTVPEWRQDLREIFQADNPHMYSIVREFFRQRRMRHKYPYIMALIYKYSGNWPRIDTAQLEFILADLKTVMHCHHDNYSGRSLPSAQMIVREILVKHGVHMYYHIPDLKNEKARLRAIQFYNTCTQYNKS
jgi:hypothetical protein